MKLVLFDIDGTLLWTDGTGRRSMERALDEVFGTEGDKAYRYDGKTDQQIAREQMRASGVSEEAISGGMQRVLDTYVRHLERSLTNTPDAAVLCQGVPALLDALESHDEVTLGLLTGNIREGAQRKLRAVGVDFDRFRVNAFGCDHAERPELPAIAQQRARDVLGFDIAGKDIVIIGDTPADIACGRSIGVRAIGVATGRYSTAELMEHAPHAAFDNLTDTVAVVSAMLD